jgi:hypothetical protein
MRNWFTEAKAMNQSRHRLALRLTYTVKELPSLSNEELVQRSQGNEPVKAQISLEAKLGDQPPD